MTKNIMEVWLRLMGDAFRGVSDAQEAVRSLSETPMTPDKLTLWTSRFMPSLMGTTQPEAVSDWMEDTWRMMGVCPATAIWNCWNGMSRLEVGWNAPRVKSKSCVKQP